ncbi:hypothetical protein QTH21_15520, partial [Clostridium perfringens]|nr:hypothetical protein [Clostridium perfringens]
LVSLVNLTPLGVLPKNLGISMPSSSNSYFNTNKEKRYLSFYGYLSFKENNILNPIEIKESTKWEKVSNQDYNKSIDEIFKIYFKKSNFKILWNSKN